MTGLHRSGGLNRRTPLVAKTELRTNTELTRTGQLKRSGWQPVAVPMQRSAGLQRSSSMPRKPSQRQKDRAATWAEVKTEAWEAWSGQCAVGDHPLPWAEMHGHHRRLKSAGGLDLIENCLPVCHGHHRYIHNLGDAAYDAGWLVRAWLDPADVPVIGR